jgi:membrane protein YdbS with pleckstrin-like domain
MPGRIGFLQKLDVFSELTEEEIIDLARFSKEYEFDDGAVIAYQRDVANRMYIVREGRLYAQRVDQRGVVRYSRAYTTGEHFGESWLFAPVTHPATVIGRGNGRLIIIEGPDFLAFLSTHRDVLEALEPVFDDITGEQIAGLSPEAWKEAEKYRQRDVPGRTVVNLLPDEIVEYKTRSSIKWLLLTEIAPIVGMLVFIPIIYFVLGAIEESILRFLAIPIFSLIFLGILAFSLLAVLDWYVDYLIITNKHLILREFELTRVRIMTSQVPIHQIQSVQTLKPDLLSNILGVGTIRVTTASPVGTIYFEHIDNPIQVEETVNRLTMRVRAISEAESQAIMRQSLEDYFELPPAYRQVSIEEEPEIPLEVAEPPPPSMWSALLNRYRWRVIDGDVTTYRKHFFVLLRVMMAPMVLALVLITMLLLTRWLLGLSNLVMVMISVPLLTLNLGWLVWRMEDWRNDTFQVTSRFVIDIDRKPFGFAESRKQAPLSRIQNVNAERPGLLPTLFNYGYVQVETAGADADIQFENVANPSEIQNDIFRRLDEYQHQQRLSEGRQRRKEYAVLLDVYKQAMEQERIPRRTPDADVDDLQDEGGEPVTHYE